MWLAYSSVQWVPFCPNMDNLNCHLIQIHYKLIQISHVLICLLKRNICLIQRILSWHDFFRMGCTCTLRASTLHTVWILVASRAWSCAEKQTWIIMWQKGGNNATNPTGRKQMEIRHYVSCSDKRESSRAEIMAVSILPLWAHRQLFSRNSNWTFFPNLHNSKHVGTGFMQKGGGGSQWKASATPPVVLVQQQWCKKIRCQGSSLCPQSPWVGPA